MTEVSNKQPEENDFYCPTCGYQSKSNGVCPKHNVQLVSYADFMNSDLLRESLGKYLLVKLFKFIVLVVCALVLFLSVYVIYKAV